MSASAIKVVPNVLSSLRLALALAYPLMPGEWRLGALVAGALSDWVDGVIARRYQAATSTGMLLDAIADKVFTLSVLVTLTAAGELAWWQTVLVLSRDLMVAGVTACCVLVLHRPDSLQRMRPRLPGKLTTTLVFLWLIAVLVDVPAAISMAVFALAALASIVAAADYLRVFVVQHAASQE